MKAGVLLACFLAALFEGLDIQATGVAAPRLAVALGLGAGQTGGVMSASSIGLLFGAAAGGWLSDRIGRRVVLISAMAMLGVFSLASSAASDWSMLLAWRFCAGLGLGGVFPNLIAMTADAAPPARRATALAMIYCGMPMGGMLAGALGDASSAWQTVFLAGGVGPLLLVPVLAVVLPSTPHIGGGSVSASTRFFGDRRGATLLLWASYFLTLWVVYSLLNWLPTMMVTRGIPKGETGGFAVLLNFGAVLGSLLLGAATDRLSRSGVLVATYVGMAASLIGLATASGGLLEMVVFATGFFVIGGQLVLYALAPILYPPVIRGTGVGAAVAVGRIGAVCGPLAVGLAVSNGVAIRNGPILALPLILVAMIAALLVSRNCAKTEARA